MKKLLLILLCSSWSYCATSQTLPRVIVLSTGGTIAGQQPNTEKAGYISGKIPIEELLKNIPSITQKAKVQGEQIASIGSNNMTVDIWIKLARRVNEIFTNNEADGVVITHGTDTMEETAYFLNLTVQSEKPVVLTGAMRAATALSADGPKNLYDAIIVASDTCSKGKGVLLYSNDNIYDAKNVVKTSMKNVDAFSSPNTGPLGQVFDSKVYYNSQTLNRQGGSAAFDVSKLDSLPIVEIVYAYAGASNTAINAFINNKVAGIIIAGTGGGSFNKAILESVKNAVKKDIKVVRSSRVVSGRVSINIVGEIDDSKLGTLVSDNLNPQKARILLMLALTVTKDKDKIQDMFLTY
ncbi:MAG: L-asparaginase [Sediminicola sp.]|jgi:L-asparaginase